MVLNMISIHLYVYANNYTIKLIQLIRIEKQNSAVFLTKKGCVCVLLFYALCFAYLYIQCKICMHSKNVKGIFASQFSFIHSIAVGNFLNVVVVVGVQFVIDLSATGLHHRKHFVMLLLES